MKGGTGITAEQTLPSLASNAKAPNLTHRQSSCVDHRFVLAVPVALDGMDLGALVITT